ncbi:phosphopantetheine-binding protein [Kitasatospora nipponensis]|uniref:phosphopantetheine-binding protein n=1 Tax=Kitasatospora nipponensis TaxID=258049 RepID=UPI003CD07B31
MEANRAGSGASEPKGAPVSKATTDKRPRYEGAPERGVSTPGQERPEANRAGSGASEPKGAPVSKATTDKRPRYEGAPERGVSTPGQERPEANRAGSGAATLPLGRPVGGTRALVLDADLRPVPVGVPGELCLGGARLARGYHRRPGLTAERFVPDPLATDPGRRLYRTGDLVRHRADGVIEFLGRIDQQVKVRGLRIELGEIEAALLRHPAVQQATAVATRTAPGENRLVGYLVARPQATLPDPEALRAHLRELLPEYMIPAQWVTLDAMPLTTSGKVDRKALPDPAQAAAHGARAYLAPRDPAEEAVAGFWSELLGVRRVGVLDDFFALGGHSLLATRVLARIREGFGVDLPLRLLFEATTVADLAAAICEAVETDIARLTDDEVESLLSEKGVR